jgi:hypothetical protein
MINEMMNIIKLKNVGNIFPQKINQFKNESDDVSATANDASSTSCNDATSVR